MRLPLRKPTTYDLMEELALAGFQNVGHRGRGTFILSRCQCGGHVTPIRYEHARAREYVLLVTCTSCNSSTIQERGYL